MKNKSIRTKRISKLLLVVNLIAASLYFSWWFWGSDKSSNVLFYLLLAGEVYHLFMAVTFWMTIWPEKKERQIRHKGSPEPSVDIFITVYSEPVEIVRQTAMAARDLDYKNHQVFILNDGKGAKKEGWEKMEELAEELGIKCISRENNKGAKAGNVNNALRHTKGEIVVIFDADMVPKINFLKKMTPFFEDEKVGFVQSPQFYKNKGKSQITSGAWEQQRFFFGPIMKGKEKFNAAFICGTNFAIRRKALIEAGGMQEDNIAEDFLTSIYVHQKGWKSKYLTEILTEGLAPEDMLSYFKQQLRWARGSLEALILHNPLFKKGLTIGQKIQYIASAGYYLSGVVVLIDIIIPLIYFFFGLEPVKTSSVAFSLFFIPFIYLNLYTLSLAGRRKLTLRAMSFSVSSFWLQLLALKSIVLRQKMGFSVTPKQQLEGNFLYLAYPHLLYLGLSIAGLGVAINRVGINASVATNLAWVIFNNLMFWPFIQASYNWKDLGVKIRERLAGIGLAKEGVKI